MRHEAYTISAGESGFKVEVMPFGTGIAYQFHYFDSISNMMEWLGEEVSSRPASERAPPNPEDRE